MLLFGLGFVVGAVTGVAALIGYAISAAGGRASRLEEMMRETTDLRRWDGR